MVTEGCQFNQNPIVGNMYLTWKPVPVVFLSLESCSRWTCRCLPIQHSPSSPAQSKLSGKMLHFQWREGFGWCVSDHICSRAVNETELAILNNPVDKVESHINVLGMCMVLVIFCECDHWLVVWKNGGCLCGIAEKLRDQWAQPQSLLHSVCSCYILTLHCREWDNFLSFWAPGDWSAINQKA